MLVFNSIKNFLSKYNFLIYILLTILLLCSCFFEFFIFIVAVFVLLVSLFISSTDIFGLLLFIYPFEKIFCTVNFLFDIIKCLLILNLFVIHIITSIKQKTTCNFKIILVFAVYCIYIILPIHTTNFRNLILLCAELCLIYIIFRKSLKINYVKVFELFSVSLIILCFFTTLRPFSIRLNYLIEYYTTTSGDFRFIPFAAGNVNNIALSLFMLFIIKYFEKINTYKFVIYSSILFLCGILSISRNFAFSMFLAYLIFSVLYLLKYKKRAIKTLIFMALGFSIVLLLSFNQIVILIQRSGGDQIFQTPDFSDPDFYKKVFLGKIKFDPGRKALWKLYFEDIMSSPLVLLFGRGIGRPLIGQMMPHNMFIYLLWVNGIFGLIIYFVAILFFINFKIINLKLLNKYLYMLIFIIPLIFNMFIDNHAMGKLLFVFLIIIIKLNDKEENKLEENLKYKTSNSDKTSNKINDIAENIENEKKENKLLENLNSIKDSINLQDDKKIELNS